MFAMFVFELMSATRPEFLSPLTTFNTFLRWTGLRAEYLPFQLIILLRKLAFTFFIALNQLGPLFERDDGPAMERGERALNQQIDTLGNRVGRAEAEVAQLLKMEMVPFAGTQQDLDLFKKGIQGFLEANTIRNSDPVKKAIGDVITERRRAAQGGAAAGS